MKDKKNLKNKVESQRGQKKFHFESYDKLMREKGKLEKQKLKLMEAYKFHYQGISDDDITTSVHHGEGDTILDFYDQNGKLKRGSELRSEIEKIDKKIKEVDARIKNSKNIRKKIVALGLAGVAILGGIVGYTHTKPNTPLTEVSEDENSIDNFAEEIINEYANNIENPNSEQGEKIVTIINTAELTNEDTLRIAKMYISNILNRVRENKIPIDKISLIDESYVTDTSIEPRGYVRYEGKDLLTYISSLSGNIEKGDPTNTMPKGFFQVIYMIARNQGAEMRGESAIYSADQIIGVLRDVDYGTMENAISIAYATDKDEEEPER